MAEVNIADVHLRLSVLAGHLARFYRTALLVALACGLWLGIFLLLLFNVAWYWAAGVALLLMLPALLATPVWLALDQLSGLAERMDDLRGLRARGLRAGLREMRSLRGLLQTAIRVDDVISHQAAAVFMVTPLAWVLSLLGALGLVLLCALAVLALLLVPWLL